MPINFNLLQALEQPKIIGQIAPSGGGDEGFGGIMEGIQGLMGGIGKMAGGSAPVTNTNAINQGASYGATNVGNSIGTSSFNQAPTQQQSPILSQMNKSNININTQGFKHGGITEPREIIFHDTAGPTLNSAVSTLKQRGLSYNYLIDRDGKVVNLVPPGVKAFHAKGYNDNTIGVSFVGGGGFGAVTPQQYQAAQQLSGTLKQQFPTLQSFAGHSDRSNAGKIDPEGFDYQTFEKNSGLRFNGGSAFTHNPNQPAQQQQNNIQLASNMKAASGNQLAIPNVYKSAQQVYSDNPVMADVAAAQAILESGLGGKPSGLAKNHNNLFGIKGKGTAGSVQMGTKEFSSGRGMYSTKAGFARNASVADSFEQHKNLMNNPRYKAVREAKTFEEAVAALKKAGYATDPNYVKKLIQIRDRYLKGQKTSMNLPTQEEPLVPSGYTPQMSMQRPASNMPIGNPQGYPSNMPQSGDINQPLQPFSQMASNNPQRGVNFGLLQALMGQGRGQS